MIPDLAVTARLALTLDAFTVARAGHPLAGQRLAIGVAVAIGVAIAVAIAVAVAIGVAIGVAIAVAIAIGVAITIGVAIAVAIGVAITVAVGVGVSVAVTVGGLGLVVTAGGEAESEQGSQRQQHRARIEGCHRVLLSV